MLFFGFSWCESSIHNQLAAELWGPYAATRLAVHRGWKHLFLFGDNEASINPVVGLRASVGLKVLQRLLKILSTLGCIGWWCVWAILKGGNRKKCGFVLETSDLGMEI